jgi:hypothetical protein
MASSTSMAEMEVVLLICADIFASSYILHLFLYKFLLCTHSHAFQHHRASLFHKKEIYCLARGIHRC